MTTNKNIVPVLRLINETFVIYKHVTELNTLRPKVSKNQDISILKKSIKKVMFEKGAFKKNYFLKK